MIFKVRSRYVDDNGIQIGKSVIARKDIDLDDVKSIEEVYNSKVKLLRSKCLLICNPPIGNVIVEKPFDEMKRLLDRHLSDNEVFVVGFRRYD